MRVQVAEALSVDVDTRRWLCARCEHDLGDAGDNYKEKCLVAARDPREVHGWTTRSDNGMGFTPDPDWCRIVEFYCPACATMLDVEYLPPGHPLTHEIELDLDALRQRFATVREGDETE